MMVPIPRLVACVWLGVRQWPFGTHHITWKKNGDSAKFPSTCFLSLTNTIYGQSKSAVSWQTNCVVRAHTLFYQRLLLLLTLKHYQVNLQWTLYNKPRQQDDETTFLGIRWWKITLDFSYSTIKAEM